MALLRCKWRSPTSTSTIAPGFAAACRRQLAEHLHVPPSGGRRQQWLLLQAGCCYSRCKVQRPICTDWHATIQPSTPGLEESTRENGWEAPEASAGVRHTVHDTLALWERGRPRMGQHSSPLIPTFRGPSHSACARHFAGGYRIS